MVSAEFPFISELACGMNAVVCTDWAWGGIVQPYMEYNSMVKFVFVQVAREQVARVTAYTESESLSISLVEQIKGSPRGH